MLRSKRLQVLTLRDESYTLCKPEMHLWRVRVSSPHLLLPERRSRNHIEQQSSEEFLRVVDRLRRSRRTLPWRSAHPCVCFPGFFEGDRQGVSCQPLSGCARVHPAQPGLGVCNAFRRPAV